MKQALELPPEARAALAGSLIESLDDEMDEAAEAAWEAESARRVEALNVGTVKMVSWAEARREMAGQ